MPNKKLLISAALTAFILVVATGIASAYQRVSSTIEAVKVEEAGGAERLDQSQPAIVGDTVAAAQSEQVLISHQEAALVATNYFGQTDLYSVENVVWEGVDAYEVVFSSGDSVYVSMTGEVLGTAAPETVVIVEEVPSSNSTASDSMSNSSSSSSSYDEDDHDESHDDDRKQQRICP